VACALVAMPGARTAVPVGQLSLSSAEFRELSDTLSEPGGSFPSDNLVSNEVAYQHVIPALLRHAPAGAYVGVGPDQNFTYVAALDPAIAFVVDLRRRNLLLHLMYKALFEISPTRLEFLARLFGRAAPAGPGTDLAPGALFDALDALEPRPAALAEAVAEVEARLTDHHGWSLTAEDRDGLAEVHRAFARLGPAMTYGSSAGERERGLPTFAGLQRASDLDGRAHGYLASAAAYRAVRAQHLANRIVPVVGDFAGPHTLRAVGAWLGARGIGVSVFYASNVEEYLFGDGRWPAFYDNLGAMPVGEASLLIRATSGSSRLDRILSLLADVGGGRIRTYADITGRAGIR
jgi:hypothetical protein